MLVVIFIFGIIIDLVCFLIFRDEDHHILVDCLYVVFGCEDQRPLSPNRFLQPLTNELVNTIISGRYSRSNPTFKVNEL